MEEPKFVDANAATILKDIIANYQRISGTTVYPAQSDYQILTCLAYEKAISMNRINEAGKSMLLDFSKAPVIDYLSSLLGVERLPANKASCTLRFNLVVGHLQVLLPLGTRVASSDGAVIYETIDDVTVLEGVNTIDITAECQTEGKTGNNYAIGSINVIQDPYAFVQSVSNIDITKGGSDEETDDELRKRVKLAPSVFSVAGSKNAYIYWTKSANTLITDVSIITLNDYMPITNPTEWVAGKTYIFDEVVTHNGVISVCIYTITGSIPPIDAPDNWVSAGQVHVFALLENGEVTTPSMNSIILNKLSSEDIRPLTDTVFVQTANIVDFSLKIDAVKNKQPDGTLTNKITTAINNYIKTYSHKLGFDIVKSKLESLCMLEGIYDVKVTIYDENDSAIANNLSVKKNQVSNMTGLTVNITETNE